MSKEIWSAVGRIGDDLVSAADKDNVKEYFQQKKQHLWLKYAGAAACFLLVFCMAAMIPATRLLSRQKMADQSAEFTTAVSDENSIQTKMQNEYPILLMHSNSDWPHYNTAEEIVDASTEIFSGKITGKPTVTFILLGISRIYLTGMNISIHIVCQAEIVGWSELYSLV